MTGSKSGSRKSSRQPSISTPGSEEMDKEIIKEVEVTVTEEVAEVTVEEAHNRENENVVHTSVDEVVAADNAVAKEDDTGGLFDDSESSDESIPADSTVVEVSLISSVVEVSIIRPEDLAKPTSESIPVVVEEPTSTSENVKDKFTGTIMEEHKLDLLALSKFVGVTLNVDEPAKSPGLTEEEADARRAVYGPNRLTPPKKTPMFLLFLKNFLNLFALLMLVAGTISLVLWLLNRSEGYENLALGSVLFGVTLLNAVIEFIQQFKSASMLESFLKLVPQNAMVVRDGKLREIAVERLTIGDLVCVRSGDKLGADVRLVAVTDMRVDNASLTGESEAQERNWRVSSEANSLHSSNIAFSGTMTVSGEAYGVVIRIGDNTTLGQIAKSTVSGPKRESQLSKEIDIFVKKIAAIAISVAFVFFIVSLAMGYGIPKAFVLAVGTFVAFVPQGLPATVTVLLSFAAKRLSELNVLVKDLQGVETLGSITMLASDKTGTLTQNKMTVVGVWMNGRPHQVPRGGTPQPQQQQIGGQSPAALSQSSDQDDQQMFTGGTQNAEALLEVCSLCSKARFDEADGETPITERKVFGDATETGLLRFVSGLGGDPATLAGSHSKVFEVPFSSATKMHVTVHALPPGSHPDSDLVMFVKGAPERVAALCSRIMWTGGEETEWDSDLHTDAFNGAYEGYAKGGQRVLAFARKYLPRSAYPRDYVFERDPRNYDTEGLCFVALVSLMDPPKRGVRKAIAVCRTAGIQVVMVTGDHPLTAEAIGRQIGLITGDTRKDVASRQRKPVQLVRDDEFDAVVVHGDEIDGFDEAAWDAVLSKKEIIFARTTPKHKLAIVEHAQAKGHIVGVSGDGVNDAPALKRADLGISMNRSGSDVSKEAAAMILLDDNFASIVTGIAEGRKIFSNLKKSIRYTLTHIMPEVLAFLTNVALGIPVPLTSILSLLFDLLVEQGPAISFAFEPIEGDAMLVPPRKVLKRFSKDMLALQSVHSDPDRDLEAACVDVIEKESDTSDDTKGAKSRCSRKLASWYDYWFTQEQTGEVLVDNELLGWCFLQGGMIVFLGCIISYLSAMYKNGVPLGSLFFSVKTYFKPGAANLPNTTIDAVQQLAILAEAQSAYFLCLTTVQWFNVFVTKKRYAYPMGMDLLTGNKWTFPLIGVSALFAYGLVYTPKLNAWIRAAWVHPILLLIPLLFGVLLFAYEFGRRHLLRLGYFGGVPKQNINLVELVRTTRTISSATGNKTTTTTTNKRT